MTLDEAKPIFRKARVTAGLCTPQWVRIFDTAAKVPQVAVAESATGITRPIATVARAVPFDDEDLLFNAPLYLRAAIVVAEAAFARIEQLQRLLDLQQAKDERQRESADLARQCAMLCQRGDFSAFLRDRHGVEDTADAERITTRVRSLLAIRSRSELNTDPAAAARWKDMKAKFDAWKKI